MGNTLFHLQFPPPTLPLTTSISTLFESIDGWKQQLAGTGSITLSDLFAWLQSGATQFGYAKLHKSPAYLLHAPTFAKPRQFETKAQIVSPANANPGIVIATGSPDLSFGFGFNLVTRNLKGWCGNGGAGAYVTLESYPVGALDTLKKYKAVFTPGSKVEFYVDDVKLGELNTQLPNGTSGASGLIYLYSYTDTAHNEEIRVSEFNIIQEV